MRGERRGFECAGICSVSDPSVSPPPGSGVLLGAQVSVARILVGSRSREVQLPEVMVDPRSSLMAGEGEGPQRRIRGCCAGPAVRLGPPRAGAGPRRPRRGEPRHRPALRSRSSQSCQKRCQEEQAGEGEGGSQGEAPPSEAAADEQARGRRVPDVALQETLLWAGAGRGHAQEVPGAGLHPPQAVCVHQRLPGHGAAEEVDPFSSGVALPHRFTDEVNKVLVFTENEQEAEVAREHGAAIVGGVELIKWILEDEIQADFYVAVPAIIPKLIPLRNKLKKKYPSTRRNSLGSDIPKMVQFFRECHEYSVKDESVIKTRIARLDMPTEHIIANLKTIIQDICTFKPSNFDPIVQRLVIRSSTSEGLLLSLDGILPQVEKAEEKEEEEDAADKDEQKPVQESIST